MKGMLKKDFLLMKNQKYFFIVVLGMAVLYVGLDMGSGFIIGYMTMLFSMSVLTTISYDEMDNGYAFLFTLPATHKDFVKAKYCFGIIAGLSGWLLAVLVETIHQSIKITNFNLIEWGVECLAYTVVFIVFISFTIPIQLKFAGEKGRVAMAMILGGFAGIVFIGTRVVEFLGIDLDKIKENLSLLEPEKILLGIILVSIFILLVSYMLSIRIMKKKQF